LHRAALLHGTALHRATLHRTALLHRTTLLHGTTLHRATLHRTALLHRTTLHRATLHRATLHRTGAVLALRTMTPRTGTVTTVRARSCGQLRSATGQLGRTHLRGLLLDRRSGYGGGDGRTRSVLLLGRLAHAPLLLVLRGGTRGGCQLGAQVLILAEQAGQFGLDLVKEGIDLVLVIAFSEADGRELLVPHVLGGQRHLFFTST
jgi:hypothetical protein